MMMNTTGAYCSDVNCLIHFDQSFNAGWGYSNSPVPLNVRCVKVKPFVYIAGGVSSAAPYAPITDTAYTYV